MNHHQFVSAPSFKFASALCRSRIFPNMARSVPKQLDLGSQTASSSPHRDQVRNLVSSSVKASGASLEEKPPLPLRLKPCVIRKYAVSEE